MINRISRLKAVAHMLFNSLTPSTWQFLDEVNGVANDAEVGAFNPAIEAATGEEADALQVSDTLYLDLFSTDNNKCGTLTDEYNSVARSRTRS